MWAEAGQAFYLLKGVPHLVPLWYPLSCPGSRRFFAATERLPSPFLWKSPEAGHCFRESCEPFHFEILHCTAIVCSLGKIGDVGDLLTLVFPADTLFL